MYFLLSEALASSQLNTIALIATDMDGTLTDNGKFTSVLLQSLERLAVAGKTVLIVTGRSAGWVQSVVHYLPVAGAIAENGGLFYSANGNAPIYLTPIPNLAVHRQQLADTFGRLKTDFPNIQESTDNCFRLTDWTFDVQGLSSSQLARLDTLTQQMGWSFTYSSVQCHIKPQGQDKASGLVKLLRNSFPQYTTEQILTVGDSPNDESLFNPQQFPHSVGVTNIREYLDELTYQPKYVTEFPEIKGFCELVQLLLQSA